MAPTLDSVTLNGASRHRVTKGFILVGNNRSVVAGDVVERLVQAANATIAQDRALAGFTVKSDSRNSSVVSVSTPFLSVYDAAHREAFVNRLSQATIRVIQAAYRTGFRLISSGVNPFHASSEGEPPILCADVHELEVFDDGEVERIYNLFRQFLPELLAVSANASVYGGAVQKDSSVRMRFNPSSFLPRYLSQFSAEHLHKLERMMRKDFGLTDLRQMDVNPLGGDTALLGDNKHALLVKSAAAVELRFVDAQLSYAFLRAQIILFQAIAMYGRSLARQGKRLPFMRDGVIDENKALAIQGGSGAVFKPDPRFNENKKGRGFSYHDKGTSERASTALLMMIDGVLLPAMQELGCETAELLPIILGAELRRRGKRCLANYAEYQQFVYYTKGNQFAAALQQHVEQLVTSPDRDFLADYNRAQFPDLASEIEAEWAQKLKRRPRFRGYVKWYSAAKDDGSIRSEKNEEFRVSRGGIEGFDQLRPGQAVTFEISGRGGQPRAVRVRIEAQERVAGQIANFDRAKGFGFITSDAGERVYFQHSDIEGRAAPLAGDQVTFEVGASDKGPRAFGVKLVEQPRIDGKVKWFDPKKRFGYVTQADGSEVFLHQDDLDGVESLTAGQHVTFQIARSPRGNKAVRVRLADER